MSTNNSGLKRYVNLSFLSLVEIELFKLKDQICLFLSFYDVYVSDLPSNIFKTQKRAY